MLYNFGSICCTASPTAEEVKEAKEWEKTNVKHKEIYNGHEIKISTFWHPLGNHVVLSIDGKMQYFTKGDMRNKKSIIKDAKEIIKNV